MARSVFVPPISPTSSISLLICRFAIHNKFTSERSFRLIPSNSSRFAPGGPGIEPRWTRGTKAAIGTAYSTSSRVWYTLDDSCVTEVYYPTIDSPQIRDLQFLVTDGENFFHDERRNFVGEIDCISEAALGFSATNREKNGLYTIHKTILGDPHQNCLLIETYLEAPPELLSKLRMYVLCAPHLEIGGWHNNGEVLRLDGHTVLVASKGDTWLVIGATVPLTAGSGDSKLFERSVNLLLAHEDKTYPGAMIASLSIPWGDEKSDDELGGYHLVWTRDMVKCVTALLAVGDFSTPLRALIYLAVSQRGDGGFYQNFWIDGRPHWTGIQLDEAAFPVLLAWRLWKLGALGNFDPYHMVRRACGFLVREGPVTAQDRWEEASGYSPSTLAAHIAALICAAEFFSDRGDEGTAEFVREYADFLESHIERWTVTTEGTLVPGLRRHYIRINPGNIGQCMDEDPNCGTLVLANQRPGDRFEFPANAIVDAGFLELVRYGCRDAHDPIIQDSLRVVDAVLKVDTPFGPCWRRYNHDGYGQRDDGSSYQGWGVGRAWPLLTGERGHYELAAGRDPEPYLRALEKFSGGIGLIPEQIWDAPELPSRHFLFGGKTGAAVPLLWAHAEYVKLRRSASDGKSCDLIEAVYDRYVRGHGQRDPMEVWKFNRQVPAIEIGTRLRIQADSPFLLHWTTDEWLHSTDTRSTATGVDIEFVDLPLPDQKTRIRFTFLWLDENRWEGNDYKVELQARAYP